MINKIYTQVLKIAKENPAGFTVDLNLNTPDEGYIVAYKETQNSHDEEALKMVIDHAIKHDGYIGGWLDGDLFYYDSCKVFPLTDKQKAIEFAIENEQIAICEKRQDKVDIINIK